MDAVDFVDAIERRRGELVKALDAAHDALEAVNRLVSRASDPLLDMLVAKMEGNAESNHSVLSMRDHKILQLGKKLEELTLRSKRLLVVCPACGHSFETSLK